MIQNLQQQQQGRVVDLEHEGPEAKVMNMDFGNGGNERGGNNVKDPPIGAPRGVEPRIGRNLQPQPVRREYLCERLCKMKPPSFEGSTNPLDAKE